MTAERIQDRAAETLGTPHAGGTRLDPVERAIADIAAGRAVVVVDAASRENEGDIVFAASKATPELLAFTIRYARGLICVPMLGADLDRLQLPQMTSDNQEHMGTAFTVSVDARNGNTTGISAADRARTIRTLVDSATEPYEIVRPGHVFPLRYADGGVLRRPGHTEAAVDLARMAGLTEAGVVAEIFNDDGTMARLPQLRAFADMHGLALISIDQLISYRRHAERMIRRVVETRMPNEFGEWRALGYLNSVDGTEHVALVLGEVGGPGDAGADVLVRMHSECLTGDVFGSRRCDCGAQLTAAMAAIAAEGRGIVLYLRGHEGRGIGLLGAIVIARYGGSWRGIKPKVAAEHGALGCIIYSDPRDDGYFQNDVFPQGPDRPRDGAQRGSVMDMPLYPGDPLTPGVGATPDAKRLPISEAKTLTKIPVLPMSYGDAQPLLAALQGPVAPDAWRGALPITYHIGPGPAKVHMRVKSNWDTRRLYDVVVRIPGSEYPDEWIVRGNHHDAWVNGAEDPISGAVAEMEEMRGLSELLKQGWKPKRTIIYCFWDGEEPGLLGSTEWGETHAADLRKARRRLYQHGWQWSRISGCGGFAHARELHEWRDEGHSGSRNQIDGLEAHATG